MSVGQMICLATNVNPTEVDGSNKSMPFLDQMIDDFYKADLSTHIMLSLEVDVPSFFLPCGTGKID